MMGESTRCALRGHLAGWCLCVCSVCGYVPACAIEFVLLSKTFILHIQFNTLCVCLSVLSPRSFAVQVDEEAKREAALPNDQPVSLQRVFLGGIPADVEQTSNRANIPFQGCIWNLIVNAVYVTSILYMQPCVYLLKHRARNFLLT